MALYRLAELAGGSIFIDGKNTKDMGLDTLRRSLAIIPQDPVLFAGTVRQNLDAFDEYDDHAVWAAIDQSNLRGALSDGLQVRVCVRVGGWGRCLNACACMYACAVSEGLGCERTCACTYLDMCVLVYVCMAYVYVCLRACVDVYTD